jgi:two-component system chemotaxis response regulator CheB
VRNRIRVLFVDDSPAARQLCADRLARESDIEILALVGDLASALRRLNADCPDVVVIDIEAPRLLGSGILKKIMTERPTPIVVFSALLGRNAGLAMEAMAAGALAVVKKPQTSLLSSLQDAGLKLSAAIREASRGKFRPRTAAPVMSSGLTSASLVPRSTPASAHADQLAALRPAQHPAQADGVRSKNSADTMLTTPSGHRAAAGGERLIAIGASTGGTQALEAVLTKLPAATTAIVIVQHMPERFTTMFAARLNEMSQIEVREAQNGDKVQRGRALLAPGGRHMMLKRSGSGYVVEVTDGPLVNRHKPSVDLMFRSVAMTAGSSALGILMTGMGDDGARGLTEIHNAGGRTIAQDEATCVVFGMPKVAIALGGVDKVVGLDKIPQEIIGY